MFDKILSETAPVYGFCPFDKIKDFCALCSAWAGYWVLKMQVIPLAARVLMASKTTS